MLAVVLVSACSTPEIREEVVAHFPADDLNGVENLTGVTFDPDVSYDGNGSIRLEARRYATFLLYEIQDIDVEETRLVYTARVRTEDVRGQVYLEMEGDFFTRGEISAKSIQQSLTGTTDWTPRRVEFMLRRTENPVAIRLMLVLNGSGKAWIDDVKVTKVPL